MTDRDEFDWQLGAYRDPRWNKVEEVELGIRAIVKRHDENWLGHTLHDARGLVRFWKLYGARS